jgi:hypothetical protein
LNNRSYTKTILVENSPQEVFDAVNNVRGWWSANIEGRTDKLGEVFTYSYNDLHTSTQKITEMIPGKKVVWHVSDAYLKFVKNKKEWIGTDIVFDISKRDGKTELRFTHIGLAPAFECYGDCSNAWGYYMGSLTSLITTGKGVPNADQEDQGEENRESRRKKPHKSTVKRASTPSKKEKSK